ncbi:tetratricopeptide repeat protein [Chryseobacterium populi]|uniref:Transcriptional regulator, luxR family n=1 Tax=Chryseobacterium populi TaxID=1144316 RepID=J2SVG8_9FLAO|nr:tetratricopeptide repeat protein [Chryseobacterium populi]EJL69567.1 transcriptional regulator, luxR family [Chryseobacterium populi]
MFPNSCFKKAFYSLFLLFFIQYPAQNYSIKELDSLTEKLRLQGNMQSSIQLNQNAIQLFEKKNNVNGLTAAYINMGGLLWSLHRYKESLEYLQKAEEKLRKIKNYVLCAKMYGEYSRNYASLGLIQQSNSSLDSSIYFAKQITDKKQREQLLYFYYTWKLANFEELHRVDSINAIQQKRLELSAQPLTFVHIAEKHLKAKELDSTEHYLNKALKISEDYSLYQKSMTLFAFGKLYTERQNYEKALDYYFQSLAISTRLHRKVDIKNAYKAISDTYKFLNDTSKKNEFLERYSDLKDSINDSEREAMQIPVDKIINEETQKERKERVKFYALISIIAVTSLFLLIFLTKKYLKNQRQKDEIIIETMHETDELKSKLNTAFEELSKLAMTNDPFFLTRFKEVYPDFYETLVTKYPHLTANDIRFSAFLRLNLSTKTIAQYKNISIRTIESRKYRLRKKLELASDVDLNKWMMEL